VPDINTLGKDGNWATPVKTGARPVGENVRANAAEHHDSPPTSATGELIFERPKGRRREQIDAVSHSRTSIQHGLIIAAKAPEYRVAVQPSKREI
jgi:hypothetical protein